MYLELEEGKNILSTENLWHKSETSEIYKYNDLLYKIYLKKEPNKRFILDELIKIENIRDIGIIPIQKIHTDTNKYGSVSRYKPNTQTLYSFLKKDCDIEFLIDLFIILSNNLKRINNEKIRFSDLHHNNILIDENNYPWYIDFDDAVVNNYFSNHISVMTYFLHELNLDNSNKQYIIDNKNLDRESLVIMFMNAMLNIEIEKLSYYGYNNLLDKISIYLPSKFLVSLEKLKRYAVNDGMYEDYIGDFLADNEVKNGCKILRRIKYENNSFENY